MISRELFMRIVRTNVWVSNLRECEMAMMQEVALNYTLVAFLEATQPRYNFTQAHCVRCVRLETALYDGYWP